MKAKSDLTLIDVIREYSSEEKARELLEGWRWANGRKCPRCGCETSYSIKGKAESKRPTAPGMYKCKDCRKLFTVRVGTIMEESKIPLSKWLLALYMMNASKKSISALQLSRMLDVTYKSAWFLCHRIRYAMAESPTEPLTGIVEVDETYVGGKPRRGESLCNSKPPEKAGPRRTTWDNFRLKMWEAENPPNPKAGYRKDSKKVPIVALVQRDGMTRAKAATRVNAENIRRELVENVSKDAHIRTDESGLYTKTTFDFASHESVCHSAGEYSRDGVHCNTAESYFSLIKRSIYGTYHNVSRQHLQAYVDEWTFRWNRRNISDGERTANALPLFEGKRLTYK